MNILLTGANGFLGKILLEKIESEGNIKTLGRKSSDYCIDLSKNNKIIFNEKFDLVIHAAGKAHNVPKTEFEIKQFDNINIRGTLNLLKGLEEVGIPQNFVFISSVSVYGIQSGIGINELHSLNAIDPYGKSKIEAEQIILNWCKKNNIICTIIRLPLVVGYNPPGNLGAMINGIRKGFYFNFSGGLARKSMVLASDVAKYILKAAELGGIYNLTDGYHPNFCELSHVIAKQLGNRFVPSIPLFVAKLLAFIGDKIGSSFPINTDKLNKITSTLTFDDSKARKAFGWNPTPVLKGFKIYE